MNDVTNMAKILWDYNVLHQKIQKSECIIALGNSDIRTAQAAAGIFNQGYGDLLVTTGGFGRLTKDINKIPEAQLFANEAIRLGVPAEKIVVEDESTNTFDNIRFTKKLLLQKGFNPSSVLIVTKPYMERRALAIAKAVWPGIVITVTSPHLDFSTYPNDVISQDLLINMLVGDTQRLMIFNESGHIDRQEFPAAVVDAYAKLMMLGYDNQIIPETNIPDLLFTVSSGSGA